MTTLQLDTTALVAEPWSTAVSSRYPHRYAVLDVETTGFDPVDDRVVQVALTLLDVDGRVESSWSSLVDPDRDPGPVHVHGITPQRLLGAPRFADIASELAALLAGRVFVAHNAVFDWGFVSAEMRRVGRALDVEHRLCTRKLAQRLDLPVENLKLSTLAAHWQVAQRRAHDAEDDTRVLVEILRRCLSVAADLAVDLPLTPCGPDEEIAARQTGAPETRVPWVHCPWELPQRWIPGSALVQGARVVVTGDTRTPRHELLQMAIDAGLDARYRVTSATSVLVCDDPSLMTRKLRDARELGVPIIDEATFDGLLAAVAAGVPCGPRAPLARLLPRAVGPFADRRVLVLGGPHGVAARVRGEVMARGGSAAVTLSAATTDVVALVGAEGDPRWERARDLPHLDPSTWKRSGGQRVIDQALVLAPGSGIELPEGQRRWLLGVRWASSNHPVGVVALSLDAHERPAPDTGVRLEVETPGEAEVGLDVGRLPVEVDAVVIAAELPVGVSFGDVGAIELTVRSPDGSVFVQSTVDAPAEDQALVLGEVFRQAGRWRVRAGGEAHDTRRREPGPQR